jgi:hypothetical protein
MVKSCELSQQRQRVKDGPRAVTQRGRGAGAPPAGPPGPARPDGRPATPRPPPPTAGAGTPYTQSLAPNPKSARQLGPPPQRPPQRGRQGQGHPPPVPAPGTLTEQNVTTGGRAKHTARSPEAGRRKTTTTTHPANKARHQPNKDTQTGANPQRGHPARAPRGAGTPQQGAAEQGPPAPYQMEAH